jgi:hypothetical protein
MLSSSTRRTSVSSNHSLAHELSASGVVELELQHWTSSLVHAESLAVRGNNKSTGKNRISQLKSHCIVDESYQTAKTYKFISDRLARFSKILVEFEQAKRHAVDTKDYDEAEKIKGDINEIKQAAESIIKQANIRITDDGQVVLLNEDLVRTLSLCAHVGKSLADLLIHLSPQNKLSVPRMARAATNP